MEEGQRQPGDGFQTTLDVGSSITAIILKGLPHEDNPPICPVRVHGRQRRAHRYQSERVNGRHVILQFPTRGQLIAGVGEA